MDNLKKRVTWNELADIYDKRTGGTARIKPMDSIFEWAKRQTDLFRVDEEGYLYLVNKEEQNNGSIKTTDGNR